MLKKLDGMKTKYTKGQKLERIESCLFQREKDSTWEGGFLLNEGFLGLLDLNGDKLEEVWDWKKTENFVLGNVERLL